MSAHVISQMPLCCESLGTTTDSTSERLFARMNPQVSLEVAFLCEGLSAAWDVTLEGFLSSLEDFKVKRGLHEF